MGEVYSARDSSLHRDVALKVLPETFARDADRMSVLDAFSRRRRKIAGLDERRWLRALAR
jgi:hypothetical protein